MNDYIRLIRRTTDDDVDYQSDNYSILIPMSDDYNSVASFQLFLGGPNIFLIF